MAKENEPKTKTQINSESIEISVKKSDLKKVLSAHKRFAISGKDVENSPLSWINFKTEDDLLILTTTDGDRALISELALFTSALNDFEFNLSMALASKLSFVKGHVDEIFIKFENGYAEFIDYEFNSSQIFATKTTEQGKYPNVNNVIPTKNNFTISVSQKLIKDIAALKAPKGYIDLSFNTKSNLAAILVETNSEELTQKAVLMPIDKNSEKKS